MVALSFPRKNRETFIVDRRNEILRIFAVPGNALPESRIDGRDLLSPTGGAEVRVLSRVRNFPFEAAPFAGNDWHKTLDIISSFPNVF